MQNRIHVATRALPFVKVQSNACSPALEVLLDRAPLSSGLRDVQLVTLGTGGRARGGPVAQADVPIAAKASTVGLLLSRCDSLTLRPLGLRRDGERIVGASSTGAGSAGSCR